MPPPAQRRSRFKGVKTDLSALLDGSASPVQVKAIVQICHLNARGALARRGQFDRLRASHGLELNDLAFDCISDLFARDAAGRYLALGSYFAAYDLRKLSDDEVYLHLQRLSFSKVRHGLFRLYGEMDPQVGKILHNIKVAVRALDLFSESNRLGETCLAPTLCDPASHLPAPEPNELAEWLMDGSTGQEFIPQLLGKLSRSLRAQETRSRLVPIVTVALAIRLFYDWKRLPALPEPAVVIDEGAIDAAKAIKVACAAVRSKTREKYVSGGKVEEKVFDLYFKTIRQMLEARLVDRDGSDFRLSHAFLQAMPGLSLDDYRATHRHRLEYLAKLTQEHAASLLKA